LDQMFVTVYGITEWSSHRIEMSRGVISSSIGGWLSQLSELVSNAKERRTAISGLIAVRPFRIAESVLRDILNASAAKFV